MSFFLALAIRRPMLRGYFLKERKLCMQNLTKERKQLPVVIMQQSIFYKIFIRCLWLRIMGRSWAFLHTYFITILIMVTEQLYWIKALLPYYMAVAIYCYYEKVHRTMCTEIVSHLLNPFQANFSSLFTPWKDQKTSGFLIFSGGIEREHWRKIDYADLN